MSLWKPCLVISFCLFSLLAMGCSIITQRTAFSVNVLGDDAALFTLRIAPSSDYLTESELCQDSPASWDLLMVDTTADIRIDAFIDENLNKTVDDDEIRVGSWFTAVNHMKVSETMQMGKSTISVTVYGNTSLYHHPMLVHNGMEIGSASKVVTPYVSGTMVTYADLTAKYGSSGYLFAFDDTNDNNMYDAGVEPTISTDALIQWDYALTKSVSITLIE